MASTTDIGCAIIGLGARGASFARRLAAMEAVTLRWLVDPRPARLEACVERLGPIRPALAGDAAAALADPAVEAVFITVPDHLHRDLAVAAFEAGKNVFLEKPLATTLDDAWAIMRAWRASGRRLGLGYVLRETPFYQAARAAIRTGRLGRVQAIHLTDNLGVVHGGSYMRRWHRHRSASGGLMVHKGCHDLDLVCWLLDSRPARVASFGGAELFARPAPAPFCSACPERDECPYVDTGAYEARTPAEAADPTAFGLDRCVFGGDKDIVDNQVVAFEMASGARGTFALAMQNPGGSERRLSVLGERGRLDGVFERGGFEIDTIDGASERWAAPARPAGGHGGGDEAVLAGFLAACRGGNGRVLASVDDAMRGLVFAFAAEAAREIGAGVAVDPHLAIVSPAGREAGSKP